MGIIVVRVFWMFTWIQLLVVEVVQVLCRLPFEVGVLPSSGCSQGYLWGALRFIASTSSLEKIDRSRIVASPCR